MTIISKPPFLCLLLVYLLGSLAKAQMNLTIGSNLTAGANGYLRSPSGDFAFGFYRQAGGTSFLVGVWFDKIVEKTLVWSPNRDTPVPFGSTVGIATSGWLVITPPNGTPLVIYNAGSNATSASIQDNGNFVLLDSNSNVLWESFKNVTDTILPGQTISKDTRLLSNANGTSNFSTGRYMLEVQIDGNVVLNVAPYLFKENGYWYTDTVNQQTSLVFNQSTALIYVANSTGIAYQMTTTEVPTPIDNYYHRATVEDTGNFQQYVYPKKNGSGWQRVWKAVTEPCFVNAICGVYGYCTSPDNEKANCSCLPGYSPLNPNVPSEGCYPNTPPQLCAKAVIQTEYKTEVINSSDLKNNDFADMAVIYNVDLATCGQSVLDDCNCMAATFINNTCRKKRIPFVNARKSTPSTNGWTAIIKVPVKTKILGKKKSVFYSGVGMKVAFSTSTFLALVFAGAAMAIYCHPIAKRWLLRKNHQDTNIADLNLRRFSFKELHEATNGFSQQLGKGSFGAVYSGAIGLEHEKIEIAVKMLEKVIEQGEREFLTELRVIGQTHHKNLVRLLGFCNEKNHRLLVYELMKNGSVSGLLFKRGEKPSWDQRAEIVLGAARGLSYLHDECATQIIHCDIKPQNVLLDNNYTAKIADFGLAKLLKKDQSRTSTNLRGTMGYIAPEWLKNAPITAKVDVYSFGVMLLEIICCRRHIELSRIEEESDKDDLMLVDWVLNCMKLGKLGMVVQYDQEVLSDFKRFERMALVGLWCVHPDPLLRPTMKKVTLMLEGTVEVGAPPLAYD